MNKKWMLIPAAALAFSSFTSTIFAASATPQPAEKTAWQTQHTTSTKAKKLLELRVQQLERAIDAKTKSKAKGKTLPQRVTYYESILSPKTPQSAVEIWAKGMKDRNGALQFAVLSPELRKKTQRNYEESYWVTGVSSPWIQTYKITKQTRADKYTWKYEVNFTLATSTGVYGTQKATIIVKQYKNRWYITQISIQTAAKPPVITTRMDEKAAVALAAKAVGHKSYMMAGGKGTDGPIPTFMYNGTEYRYLGTDLDTKKELLAYLQETYTPEASEALIQQAKIIEYKGRMAQPNADGGSMLEWNNAQATFVKGQGTVSEYELKVPYGEGTNVEFSIERVTFRYVQGIGWRVQSFSKGAS